MSYYDIRQQEIHSLNLEGVERPASLRICVLLDPRGLPILCDDEICPSSLGTSGDTPPNSEPWTVISGSFLILAYLVNKSIASLIVI